MHAVIYGRPGCPFCLRAQATAQTLEKQLDNFSYEYINMWLEGVSKEDLSVKAGKQVTTVPQVFINGEHIGGSDDFAVFAQRQKN